MSPLSRKSSRMHTSLTACTLSLLLSSSAWAETIHVHVPTVRIKPVVVPVKPTVHLPVSAGLGRQRLSNGGTAPGRWHGPNKGNTTNGSTAPASPGAAAYSATVNAPAGSAVGVVAGQKGATKGGTNASSPGAAAYGVTIGTPPAGTTAGEKGTPVVGVPVLQTLGLGPDWFANTRNGIGGDPLSGGCDTCLDKQKLALAGAGVVAFASGAFLGYVGAASAYGATVASPFAVAGASAAGIAAGAFLATAAIIDAVNSPSPSDPSAGANNYGPGASAPGGAATPSSSTGGNGSTPQTGTATTVEATQPDAGATLGDDKGSGAKTPIPTNGGADPASTGDAGTSGGGGGGASQSGTTTTSTTEAAQQSGGSTQPGDDTSKTGNKSTSGGSNGGGPNGASGGGPVGGNGSTAQSAETPTGTSSGDQPASTSNTVSNTDDHGPSDAGPDIRKR